MTSSTMTFMTYLPIIMMLAFSMQQSHLLMTLLSLEGLMLSLVLILPIIMTLNSTSMTITSIIILTLGACEASIGLALLVSMSRLWGSDLVKTTQNL